MCRASSGTQRIGSSSGFRNGAVDVKHRYSRSSGLARSLEHEEPSPAADRRPRHGQHRWLPWQKLLTDSPGAAQRRNYDPGCVRRQALASVRGRRSGRQRHAWSKTIPECRSDLIYVLDRNRAVRRTGFKTRIFGNRVPARGHRWIATFRRDSDLIYVLDRNRAVRRTGFKTRIFGNRVPARGHRWIATFRRDSFLLS